MPQLPASMAPTTPACFAQNDEAAHDSDDPTEVEPVLEHMQVPAHGHPKRMAVLLLVIMVVIGYIAVCHVAPSKTSINGLRDYPNQVVQKFLDGDNVKDGGDAAKGDITHKPVRSTPARTAETAAALEVNNRKLLWGGKCKPWCRKKDAMETKWEKKCNWKNCGGCKECAKLEEAALCSQGIRNSDVCCASSCGSCGGSGCARRPGGNSNCCTSVIRESGQVCVNPTDVSCVVEEVGLCKPWCKKSAEKSIEGMEKAGCKKENGRCKNAPPQCEKKGCKKCPYCLGYKDEGCPLDTFKRKPWEPCEPCNTCGGDTNVALKCKGCGKECDDTVCKNPTNALADSHWNPCGFPARCSMFDDP